MRVALIALLILGIVVAQECTENDYAATYTSCFNNQRALIWYVKETANCSGGFRPQNVFGLPCNVVCKPGEFLPPGARNCSSCPQGQWSFGTGFVVSRWPLDWLSTTPLTTYCILNNIRVNSTTCGFRPLPDFSGVWAGRNQDSLNVILEMQQMLSVNGSISFTYGVDAEIDFDGLTFEVNGQVRMPLVSSTSQRLQRFSLDLGAGVYTFRWRFAKDSTLSVGRDTAWIGSIELSGVGESVSKCEPCEPGTFNNLTGQARTGCSSCVTNTFSTGGAATCSPCNSTDFSYPHSANCSRRLTCTTNDYTPVFGDCIDGVEQIRYEWIAPTICDTKSLPLPASSSRPCRTCLPGYIRNQTTWHCDQCPSGFSARGDSCVRCGAGFEAVKGLYYWNLQSMPSNFRTGCIGECGTPGWTLTNYLNGSELSSGTGHLAADVWLNISFVADRSPVQVSLTFQFVCTDFCSATLLDNAGSVLRWYSFMRGNDTFSVVRNMTGDRNVTLSLSFNTRSPQLRDRMILTSLSIDGAETGSASQCRQCPFGAISAEGSDRCTTCPPAFQSNDARTRCEACPAGTFSETMGGACLPCGSGTTSTPGSTACTRNCTWTNRAGRTFDLAPLSRLGVVGPVIDKNMRYFVSVCNVITNSSWCVDSNRRPLNASICQQAGATWFDVGHVINYREPANNTVGFEIAYQYGTSGCNPARNRETVVHFECDVSAGVGAPVGFHNGTVELPLCSYHLRWRSQHACPLCTEDDFSSFLGECENGLQIQRYFWREPRRCFGGVSLPADRSIRCQTVSRFCPAGTFFQRNTTSCVNCPANTYSIGGGTEFTRWNDYNNFRSIHCADQSCSAWLPRGQSIRSGRGAARTTLELTETLVQNGSITFDYSLYTFNDEASLRFSIDNADRMADFTFSTSIKSFTFNVSSGAHVFRWTLVMDNPYSDAFAEIYRVAVTGTSLGVESCIPCSAGSGSQPGSSRCTPCGTNTYAPGLGSGCLACPPAQYALTGWTQCIQQPQCTAAHFETFHTPCINRSQIEYARPLEPFFCALSGGSIASIVPNRTLEVCDSCPLGTYRNESTLTCSRCALGKFGDLCSDVPSGSESQYVQTFFFDNTTSAWPAGWSTTCFGRCGSSGWRVRGDRIDSGDHSFDDSAPLVSSVSFSTELTRSGRVTFAYLVPQGKDLSSSFEFFIDSNRIPFIESGMEGDSNLWRQFSTVVDEGMHTLTWRLQQGADQRDLVFLSNITLYGVSPALATGILRVSCPSGFFNTQGRSAPCRPCPVGRFANDTGLSECSFCPSNTTSSRRGSAACEPCGAFATSNSVLDQPFCNSTCLFDVNRNLTVGSNVSFDLSFFKLEKNRVLGPFNSGSLAVNVSMCANELQCVNEDGEIFASSVCVFDPSRGHHINYGSVLDFSPFPADLVRMGLVLRYNGGSMCLEEDVQRPRTTTVEINCESVHYPTPLVTLTDCDLKLSWYSSYGCPVCNDTQYDTVKGPCDGYQLNVYQQKRAGELCYDNRVNKVVGTELCLAQVTDNPNVLGGILIGLFAGICFFMIVCIVCVARNRSLSRQFAQLQAQLQSSRSKYDKFEMQEGQQQQ